MANALTFQTVRVNGAEETAKFLRYFDKGFDCLNARSTKEVKADRRPYTSEDDKRLQVS